MGGIVKYIKEETIKPILIGGVIGGVLSITPIISYLNYFCCLLCVLSGAITAHLMTEKYIPTDRDYMISGALSGVIAALVDLILSLLISIIIYGTTMFMGAYYFSDLNMLMGSFALIIAILSIPINILLGATFGLIGAIIYKELKNK